jgi:hypothetical protein
MGTKKKLETHKIYLLSDEELAMSGKGPLPYAAAALHPKTNKLFYYTSVPECGPKGLRDVPGVKTGPFPKETKVTVLMGHDGRLTSVGELYEIMVGPIERKKAEVEPMPERPPVLQIQDTRRSTGVSGSPSAQPPAPA